MRERERDPAFENIENLQESVVLESVRSVVCEEIARGQDLCSCPQCLADVAALALNALPPQYVADSLNHDAFNVDPQVRGRQIQQAKAAIRKAIPIVSARRHHD